MFNLLNTSIKLVRKTKAKRKWYKIYETKLLKYKIAKYITRIVNWDNG